MNFFQGLYDFTTSWIAGRSFWPAGGNGIPPVNAVDSDSGQIITPKSALMLSAAWACVWLIAETIATLPLILMRQGEDGKRKPDIENPLYAILRDQPNAEMSSCEFWQVMVASMMLWGNGYAEKKRIGTRIISLDPLRPEYMTVYRTPSGSIRYKYDLPGNPRDFSSSEIFHLRDRTLDGLVGLSRIEYARHSLGLARSADEASGKTFANGLRASGFLKTVNWLKPEQRDQIKKALGDFTGSAKQGQVMVLEGNMDFAQLSMKPQDVELLESRRFAIEDLCRWFGVPPILIGHAGAGQTMWGSGIEQILLGWLTLGLRPVFTRIEKSITRQLIAPEERATVCAHFNADELMRADSAGRASLYSSMTQNGIFTRNECREKENLPPVEGGDGLTVQSNLIPIDQLGKSPQQVKP